MSIKRAAATVTAAASVAKRRVQPIGNPRELKLERYFAIYEFSAEHLLCCSDIAPLAMKEVLAAADEKSLALWDNLTLGYTESRGHPQLLEEIAATYDDGLIAKRHVLGVVPQEGILLAVQATVGPGDDVIVTWPAYQSLYEDAQARGARVTQWHVRGGGAERLHFDVSDLEAAVAACGGRPALIVVNFPHNPTGCHLSRADFMRVVEIARAAGAYLLSDEMYRCLTVDGQAPLPAACEVYDKGISLSGVSKAYSLPGLRVGWLVCREADGGPDGVLHRASCLKDYSTVCGSAPSEVLAIMALRQRHALLRRANEIVADGRRVACDFFARHADLFHYFPSDAGPCAFPALRRPGDGAPGTAPLSAVEVQEKLEALVKATGVMLAPPTMFEVEMPHFRLGFGRLDCAKCFEILEANLAIIRE